MAREVLSKLGVEPFRFYNIVEMLDEKHYNAFSFFLETTWKHHKLHNECWDHLDHCTWLVQMNANMFRLRIEKTINSWKQSKRYLHMAAVC
jgi:hypothetical protein